MRQRPYDYRGFSIRRLNEPRFSHLKLLLGWVAYFSLYFLTENLIPRDRCHVIHCAIDDIIPFREEWVIIYVAWYLFVAGSLAWTLFFRVDGFKGMQKYIIVTQLTAMACYVIFPSIQLLRPEIFPRHNFFTWVLGIIYAFDTPTGVCPSLHVAYSAGIVSAALKDRALPRFWKAAASVFLLLVCLAVCFVKQHSFVDVAAAVPLCLLAEVLVYGKNYWLPRLRGMAPSGQDDRRDPSN